MVVPLSRTLLGVICGAALLACGDDDDGPLAPTTITSYDKAHEWTCAQSESCQDVFEIRFEVGTTAKFEVSKLGGNSILQMALYAPGVNRGEANLFTGNQNEYRCTHIGGCDIVQTEVVDNFGITATGMYRLAITRDYMASCGADGNYRLVITTDKGFTNPALVLDDVKSQAPWWYCPD